ncbi:hypothetical protein HID58_035116 [Brassica napus]|uniref:Uncharacterized protein n=1 Tax=Brassica napus TaxID=3708 RepID=A0ABQ8C400_BRANA|nr:hypothetical protein HID58_035116 [Brassica napus]
MFFIFSKMPKNKKCYLLIPKRQELLLERFASFGSIPSTYIEGSGDWHRVRKRRLQMRFKIFATQKLIKGKRPLNKKKTSTLCLVGRLCLILHDMIVHTPLEELQTLVIKLLLPKRVDVSSVWDQTCIHSISFSTWIRKLMLF